MRLKPETLAAHMSRHAKQKQYPPHTLAPDPKQPELPLVPRRADICPACHGIHANNADRIACITAGR